MAPADTPTVKSEQVLAADAVSWSNVHTRGRVLSQDQLCAPYAEALQQHAASAPENLMVPGHGRQPKTGGAHLASALGDRVVELDVPLMVEGIDLGEQSPLAQAQRLAAAAWGAKRTWFMTNGASQANRTAALAVRGLGERVLMQRSAHSSFSDGVLLAGLIPSFVLPHVDEVHGISHGLTSETLESALAAEAALGHKIASVYIVSPSYFGATADVEGLARVAHAYGAALVVDGAWGAHFGFHPDLPESPVRLGADLVVSSTHKIAGSLTQSAMLHLGEGPLAQKLEPLVQRAFMMTTSTSASSILMASLDLARLALVTKQEAIGVAIAAAEEFRTLLRRHDKFSVVSDGFHAFSDVVAIDPLRIPIDVSALGQSGHWVRERLISHHGVYFEMSTSSTIVAVIGAFATPNIPRIMRSLDAVATAATELLPNTHAVVGHDFPPLPAPGQLRMSPRDAFFGESELVAAADAIGRVSADTLAAYPPGIPNLIPGEEITQEIMEFLRAIAGSPSGHVRGAADPQVNEVRVTRRG